MKRVLAVAVSAALVSGCASIIDGGTQPVTFNSSPDGAALTVYNRAGEKIHAGTTPTTLPLKRGAGFFKSEQYTVKLQKDGFAAKELVITSTTNGWYFGNILVGGLIGILIVDPATGAMFELTPDKINASLDALPVAQTPGLTILTTDAVPAEVMSQATPIK